MNLLCQLVYISSTKELLNQDAQFAWLESFRHNNLKHSITGMLLYNDGNVMQVIEGSQPDVDQLFANIKADDRHTGIIVLSYEVITQRDFGKWAMSFKNISGSVPEDFSHFMSTGKLSKHDERQHSSLAMNLLLKFRG